MRCDDVQQDLTAFFRGELGLDERAAIERHLAECPACAEEAAAVRDVGHRLRSGLSDWVEQGICPPDVMARIETSIRASERKAWWRSWQAMTGAVAAAAVLLVLFGQQARLPEHLAALPIVGPVASYLLDATATHPADYRLVPVKATAIEQGVTLTVSELEASSVSTRIHYLLQGSDLDTAADFTAVAPVLTTAAGVVPFQRMTVSPAKSGEVVVDAYFGPIPAGGWLNFSLRQVPVKSAAGGAWRPGRWQVEF